jgi:hypothetical protein
MNMKGSNSLKYLVVATLAAMRINLRNFIRDRSGNSFQEGCQVIIWNDGFHGIKGFLSTSPNMSWYKLRFRIRVLELKRVSAKWWHLCSFFRYTTYLLLILNLHEIMKFEYLLATCYEAVNRLQLDQDINCCYLGRQAAQLMQKQQWS